MIIKGTIQSIGPRESVGHNQTDKVSIVLGGVDILDAESTMVIAFMGDNVNMISVGKYLEGDLVTVTVEIKAAKRKDKLFQNINGKGIKRITQNEDEKAMQSIGL